MLLLSEPSSARLALLGVPLFVATLALLSPAWLVVGRIYPGRNVFFARWGFSHLLRVVALGVGIHFALNGLLPIGWTGAHPLLEACIRIAIVLGGMSGLCAYFAGRLEPEGARTLGLQQDGQVAAAASGLFLYLATLPGVAGLALVSPWILEQAGSAWEIQSFMPQFLELEGAEVWLAAFLMVLVVPLFEEAIFRGFLQPLLVQNLREVLGVGVTSFLFALLHGESMFLPIFGLSIVLGATKLRTQRLFAVWLIHAFHNGLALLLYTSFPALRELL